jgi:hypothetical protein
VLQLWRLDLISGLLRCSDVSCPFDFRSVQVGVRARNGKYSANGILSVCCQYPIVERSFAWLGRNRRLSKDYEYRVQTSETMVDLAAIRLMLNRIALA